MQDIGFPISESSYFFAILNTSSVLRYYGTYSRSNLSSCPTSHLIAIAITLRWSYQPQFSIELFTILDSNRIFEISQYASSLTEHALGIAIARVLYSVSFIIFMYPMLALFFTYFPSDMRHCMSIGWFKSRATSESITIHEN